MPDTIDVSGLSPEAVRAVEALVGLLKEKAQGDETAPGSATSSVGLPADRWQAAAEAVKGLTDYDFGAWEEQRAHDRQHGQDHLK